MKLRIVNQFLAAFVLAAVAVGVYLTRDRWFLARPAITAQAVSDTAESGGPTGSVLLSDQVIANLKIRAAAIQPGVFWKTIQVPGMVIDRPGRSDRSIVSPVTGVVAKMSALPGDTVADGQPLFTIRLLSESIHQLQADLAKTVEEIKVAKAQKQRYESAGGAIPEVRIFEIANQIKRLENSAKAARRELETRGLTPGQIDEISGGTFVSEITIRVPSAGNDERKPDSEGDNRTTFELQECKVELGQQVQAGQTLCLLANHRWLSVEGRAFREETPLLERSVKELWPVEIDFQEVADSGWPETKQEFRIQHLSNVIDPVNRTFAFLIPLDNEFHTIKAAGRTQMLWRFRPGQKVRIRIRTSKLDNVFTLPAEAIVNDGGESFVFTQNVNRFERQSVQVLFHDRQRAALANDSSLLPGMFVVQSAAAQLNRMAKSQAGGVPKGFHVHADGSLHKNEDEGK